VGQRGEEPVPALGGARRSLGGDQGVEVSRVLDALLPVVAAPVARDLLRAIEDADLVVRGHQGQGLADERRRDRVVVAVEAEVGRLATRGRLDAATVEGMLGQGQQPAALLFEGLGHGLRGVAGAGSGVGPALAPLEKLGIEVGDVAKAARGEEAIAQEADLALDAPLLVASCHGAGTGEEVVVAGELEQPGMKLDRVALAGEHRALEIVVEKGPGRALEEGQGLDVSAQEALERLVEGEEHVEGAGPAEHHDEGGQGPARLSDLHVTEVSPVDLGLLTGQRRQAQEGLGLGPRPQAAHDPARLHDRAGVAPGHDHLVDAGRAQAGILLEGRADEVQIGVEPAGSHRRGGLARTVSACSPISRAMVPMRQCSA
jgi:hypothetical protein